MHINYLWDEELDNFSHLIYRSELKVVGDYSHRRNLWQSVSWGDLGAHCRPTGRRAATLLRQLRALSLLLLIINNTVILRIEIGTIYYL